MKFAIYQDGEEVDFDSFKEQREKYVGCTVDLKCTEEQETIIYKYAANITSFNHDKSELQE